MQSAATPLVAVYRVKRRKTEIKVTVKWALSDTCKSNERLDTRKRNMPTVMKQEDDDGSRTFYKQNKGKAFGWYNEESKATTSLLLESITKFTASQSDPIPDPKEGSPTQPPSKNRQRSQTRVTGRGAERKSFEQRMEDLKAYKKKHGRLNVKKSDDKSLYDFCNHMRRSRNNPEKSDMALTDYRKASLDTLGFEWTVKKLAANKSFEKRIEHLCAYKEKHGHINVRKSDDKSLSAFCNNMRRARKNPAKSGKTLTDDRIASLDALGFEWSERQKSFEQRIDNLKVYKEKHGHINVSQSEDKSLYGFCYNVRYAHINPEKSTVALTDDCIASLNALGFEWNLNSDTKSFEQRIKDLKAYKEKHGHVNVKEREDKSLYRFCVDIRRARNNPGKSHHALINEERIASLDALGFDWSGNDTWSKSFAQRIADLRAYKEKHGHINVKKSDNKSLNKFCEHIRYARNNPGKSSHMINNDRIASLGALGFDWSNSGIKSIAEQTDRPPSKKRKQTGQGKIHTATKKNRGSAKNHKGCATSSDQMEVAATAKDAAALFDPIPNLGHSGNDVSDVTLLEVSTTTALASDKMDAIDLTTDMEAESVNKHQKSFANILLEEKGKRLVQVKQEMVETQESLNDVREDLDIANDTVTQQSVFTDAWQNKFDELAKLAEAGRVDGAKILEIRNRSISTGQGDVRGADMYQ